MWKSGKVLFDILKTSAYTTSTNERSEENYVEVKLVLSTFLLEKVKYLTNLVMVVSK